MLDEKEISSMIYLLDDSDDRVVNEVADRLVQMGIGVIPFLERVWPEETNLKRQTAILGLIKKINAQLVYQDFKDWHKSKHQDLLDGLMILEKVFNPNVDKQLVDNKLDKIKLDAWLELNYELTSFEKVKILNHIFFDVHKFKGDTDAYHSSKNSFISHVLESKKGNPISLAIIYSIVAQRLNIPVYGVNLPQHFILGYIRDIEWQPLKRFNDQSILRDEAGSEIMFYINPFNKGLIFNRDNISKFLSHLNLEPQDDFFKACSNLDIVQRVLRNLEVSYDKEKNESKLEQVRVLLEILA